MRVAYDTDKIRQAAARIAGVSDDLTSDAQARLNRAEQRVEDWRGQAAEACRAQIRERKSAIGSEAARLAEIAQALYDVAEALEEADRELAGELR